MTVASVGRGRLGLAVIRDMGVEMPGCYSAAFFGAVGRARGRLVPRWASKDRSSV